jgi:rsbT co-antagonist protein RsbR
MTPSDHADLRTALSASPQALLEYWRFLESHYDDVQADTQGAMEGLSSLSKVQSVMTPVFQDPEVRKRRIEMYRQAFVDGNWEPYGDFLREIGRQFAQRGMDFHDYSSLLFKLRRKLSRRLRRELAAEAARLELALEGVELFLGMALAFIGDGYLLAKQEIIRDQGQAILELSTPVLQVRDRLLILPLVGALDSLRAQQATAAMLAAIRSARALVMIIDVTGVPLVDTGVALHFTRSAEAARLMGATVYITGISTAMARSMVALGVELDVVTTFSTLQGGLEAAEKLLAGAPALVAAH